VLFSQPDVASFLSDSFECAWESVRPVPRLSIDFGDGRRLERTLRGNIATYLCTSAGETFDLVPGLVSAPEYVQRLREGMVLFERLASAAPAAGALHPGSAMIHDWHQRLADTDGLLVRAETADIAPSFRNVSKSRVERPLELALVPPLLPLTELSLDTLDARRRGYREAHTFLARSGPRTPADLTRGVYRELLHVDLDDPYLGLAADVLGGEVGRH
jgi:hypothetical protein